MKKALIIAMSALSINTFAQKVDASKVPANIKAAFEKTFPSIRGVKWEKEKGNYEANFEEGGKEMAVLFDVEGEQLEIETSIGNEELPKEAKSYMQRHYKEQVKKVSLIRKKGDVVNYEVEIKGMDVIFDEKGNFIKTTKD